MSTPMYSFGLAVSCVVIITFVLVAVDLSPQTTGETLFIFMQPIYCFYMGACAQWRVKWLIKHSTSHQLLWCIDSFVLRNPPLRQAPNRWLP